jgi:uncharacterized protein (TIGR02246 family)
MGRQSVDPEYADESVRAVFEVMSEAWARHDAVQFAACYADGATEIGPGNNLRGRGDITGSMAAAFAGPLKDSLRPHSAQMVRFLPGGTAIVVTESATIFPGEAVAPPDRRHLVTWLLTRHGDRWLVEANHICQA